MLQNLKMFQTAKYFETDIKTTFSYGKKKNWERYRPFRITTRCLFFSPEQEIKRSGMLIVRKCMFCLDRHHLKL